MAQKSYRHEMKELFKILETQGWQISKGKSWKLIPPDPLMPIVFLAQTPSDNRALKNVISYLRKSGAKI